MREKRKNMTCAAEHQILSAIIIIGVCIDRTWVSYESYIVASDKDNRNKILFRALAPRPKKLIASLVYICNHVESSQRGGKGVAERNQSKRVGCILTSILPTSCLAFRAACFTLDMAISRSS